MHFVRWSGITTSEGGRAGRAGNLGVPMNLLPRRLGAGHVRLSIGWSLIAQEVTTDLSVRCLDESER
jgi:hypothetical protein